VRNGRRVERLALLSIAEAEIFEAGLFWQMGLHEGTVSRRCQLQQRCDGLPLVDRT